MTIQSERVPDDVLAAEAAAMMHAQQGYDWTPDPNLSHAYYLVRPGDCWLVVLAAPPEALDGVLDVLGSLPNYQGAACLVAVYLVIGFDAEDGPMLRVQPVGVENATDVAPITFAATLVLEAASAAEVDTVAVEAFDAPRLN